MPNVHPLPDTLAELQATWGDLGPQVIVSHSGLTVPASSLTMPSVAANGYVLSPGPPARLVYVSQPAVSVTLPSTAATYWLAVSSDLHTPVSGWTRRSGSHYLFQANATQPANPSSGLVFCSVVVAGAVITTVTPLTAVTSAPMSRQNSNAVAITGGTLTLPVAGLSGGVNIVDAGTQDRVGLRVGVNSGPNKWNLYSDGTAPNFIASLLALGTSVPNTVSRQTIAWRHANLNGLLLQPSDSDTGAYAPVVFMNLAGTIIGSISTTATATAYNTSSDVRLKHAVQPLTDALTALQALRPVRFRWNSTDEQDIGFLAHEAQQVVPTAVRGLPDEVHPDGSVKPQQIDHSRLVPLLTAALKEAVAQVEALATRLETLEAALGG